jgi:hypothetical protein
MVDINYLSLPSAFVNAYITKDYNIIAVFNRVDNEDPEFIMWITNIHRNPYHIETTSNEDEVLVRFRVAHKFKANFDTFLKGKYSKFTDDYKEKLCRCFGKKTVKDNHEVTEYNIIYPQDFKRKQIAEVLGVEPELIDEVFPIPDLDIETYMNIEHLLAQRTEHDKRQRDFIPDNGIQ